MESIDPVLVIVEMVSMLGLVIAESVMLSDTAGTAVKRILLILGLMLAGFVIGGFAAIVVIAIIAIIVLFFVVRLIIAVVFNTGFGSGGRRKRIRLDSGTELSEEQGILGDSHYRGDDGREYRENPDGTFSKKD